MDYTDIQQLVVDKIKALAVATKFEAFETALPPGVDKRYEEQAPWPYVLYEFGNKNTDERDAGITGTRDDMKWTTVMFEIVSPNPETTRRLGNIVRNEFLGWSPGNGWGEFVESLSATYKIGQPFNAEFWPPRYARNLAFVVDVDAD